MYLKTKKGFCTTKSLYFWTVAKIGTSIDLAVQWLQKDLIAIPTETVYGLAANALSESLVLKIFEVKKRPSFDPLIVHTSSIDRVYEYCTEFPEPLKHLAEAIWPGPLTLLLNKKPIIPDITTSGLSKVGMRIPAHPLTLKLLHVLDFPLAAPSANPFGYISPTKSEHVQHQLGSEVPYILDGGDCNIGIESTIVGMEGHDICVYRLGGASVQEIESIVGKVKVKVMGGSNPLAPGMLDVHYAPRKSLFVFNSIDEGLKKFGNRKITAILPQKPDVMPENINTLWLSDNGNVKQMAQRLFHTLRIADQSDADLIITQWVPQIGLGHAINDRLKRASSK